MLLRCVLLLCCFVGLAACGGEGSPPPGDALEAEDAGGDAPPDSANVCTTPNECPCFSNDECPAGTRCHAETPDSIYCEPGPRGTGAAGATCSGENDCASALCVEAEAGVMRCSQTCDMPEDCPDELPRCLGGLGICARDP